MDGWLVGCRSNSLFLRGLTISLISLSSFSTYGIAIVIVIVILTVTSTSSN